LVLRAIDAWIEKRKSGLPVKSGQPWGVLVHGNRILATRVFSRIGKAALAQPIVTFADALASLDIDAICEGVYQKMLNAVQNHYPKKFLATLFKNSTMSKHVYTLSG